ncbi:NAD(P)-binding protein [Aspergillus heteromorphus CBS 117.55]|uniref:NAD(P)-binding protein n=1 Tax=Aspergillus heteromorphus CBS 117.55 TaxID=1448321 RepID=A0A317WLP3_9EURO|nr:NAD(P)-binding protein [Aspergillus heteromorphus CBS 117.55]PWY85938.1 NAD(P)-binding protein [Aspergillus heteromorphus CBS 117.55]
MKILLTGASGCVGSHVLHELGRRGHEVVVTADSATKGEDILRLYTKLGTKDTRLSYVVIDTNIAQKGAFDAAVQSNPPFDAVIHTHGHFPPDLKDLEQDVLRPIVDGTTSLLQSIKAHAPQVRRVILMSSTAAIIRSDSHPAMYDESVWNNTSYQPGLDLESVYAVSTTMAEKTAFMFLRKKGPNFSVTTICGSAHFGPVVNRDRADKATVDPCDRPIWELIEGNYEAALPPPGSHLWTDVRDVALAHVQALEAPEAPNQRFLVAAKHYDNKKVVQIMRDERLQLDSAPPPTDHPIDSPADLFKFDNTKSVRILGLNYRSLQDSVKDTVQSIHQLRG